MATTKEIKRRTKSIKNTKKITKAMELVAASKMKKAVDSTLASRMYSRYAQEILESLESTNGDDNVAIPVILQERPVKNVLIVLVTSNRGLCGAYNSQVIKKVIESIRAHDDSHTLSFIAVGKKGEGALRRIGQNVVASFVELPENISLRDANPIAELIMGEYRDGRADKILVAYTDYISALTQTPKMRQLLPITRAELAKAAESVGPTEQTSNHSSLALKVEYLFEPDREKVLEVLVQKLAVMQIYQMLLESVASEQSARMLAMKNASDAAGEMIDELTLLFNKARQAGITQEISEISAGMTSLS